MPSPGLGGRSCVQKIGGQRQTAGIGGIGRLQRLLGHVDQDDAAPQTRRRTRRSAEVAGAPVIIATRFEVHGRKS